MVVLSSDAGTELFKRVLLLNGHKITKPILTRNGGRHHVVTSMINGREYTWYVLFKHAFFWSFNKQVSAFVEAHPEFKGVGESINVEHLKFAIQHKAYLVYVYENESVYFIYSSTLKSFCDLYNLYRVREKPRKMLLPDFTGEQVTVNEAEAIFPVKILTRFY